MLVLDNETLRRKVAVIERRLAQRDATIAKNQRRIDDLMTFGPDRPADLFAPVRVEIASRSGGTNFDGKPGDDGVTVYLRPIDADGDVVKVPGRITVLLTDTTNLGAPRTLGTYVFSDTQQIRRMWHSRFGTQHYTLRCPFAEGIVPYKGRRVTVTAEFVDFLTGKTLRATKEVRISPIDD